MIRVSKKPELNEEYQRFFESKVDGVWVPVEVSPENRLVKEKREYRGKRGGLPEGTMTVGDWTIENTNPAEKLALERILSQGQEREVG